MCVFRKLCLLTRILSGVGAAFCVIYVGKSGSKCISWPLYIRFARLVPTVLLVLFAKYVFKNYIHNYDCWNIVVYGCLGIEGQVVWLVCL